MKKNRYTEEQIICALKQVEMDTPVEGGLPETWNCETDVLSLEEAVCRHDTKQCEENETP